MHTLFAIARNSVAVVALLGTLALTFVVVAKWLADNSEEPGAH